MTMSRDTSTTEDENGLVALFGHNRLSPESWKGLAAGLLDYVFDPRRKTAIKDYPAITSILSERSHVRCVEVDSNIHGVGAIKTTGEQLARFSIRTLYLLYPAQYYIAVNRALNPAEKRLAILHEMGHMALHFDVLQSISTLYHRICLNPGMEFFLGRFRTLTEKMLSHQEKAADLFAVTWLVPLRIDEDSNLSYGEVDNGLEIFTVDGYKERLLREIFSECEGDSGKPQNVRAWNDLGANTRGRLSSTYPQTGSLVERMKWILFNRQCLKDMAQEHQELLSDYFKLIGPPGRVPELIEPVSHRISRDPEYAWIPRVMFDEALAQVDSDHWEPFLVCANDGSEPYYVPITPVPSTNFTDSKLGWVNMAKSSHSVPQSLPKWLAKAQGGRYGLMIFPRTPAERIMDSQRAHR